MTDVTELEDSRPWWLRAEPVLRDGVAGTRYYDATSKWLTISYVWLLAAFALLLAPVPNGNFPTWLNVGKGVVLGAAAIVIAGYALWLGRRMGLTVWTDSVSLRFYFRVESYALTEVVGLRLSDGWPWRALLDTTDGESHWVLFLAGAAPFQPLHRRRSQTALRLVLREIRAAARSDGPGLDAPGSASSS